MAVCTLFSSSSEKTLNKSSSNTTTHTANASLSYDNNTNTSCEMVENNKTEFLSSFMLNCMSESFYHIHDSNLVDSNLLSTSVFKSLLYLEIVGAIGLVEREVFKSLEMLRLVILRLEVFIFGNLL